MDKFNSKTSKKARFSKTLVTPAKRISSPPTDDNMIQQRDIHCGGSLSKLVG
jgi:hypothetical protein